MGRGQGGWTGRGFGMKLIRMRNLLFLPAVLVLTAFAPNSGQSIRPVAPSAPVAAEYLQTFSAEGRGPEWRATVRPGEVRIAIAGQAERVIPLAEAQPCFVVGCEGVMIEQRVSHRHHGVSLSRAACRVEGTEEVYPYRVSISVLASARDRRGTTYRGCAKPAA